MEASIRFALANEPVSTVLVGYSTMEHLERAITVVNRGPLPAAALDLLRGVWAGMSR
jgi:aryl-alcohol dehydrogenase-like predicted oxidoreductase